MPANSPTDWPGPRASGKSCSWRQPVLQSEEDLQLLNHNVEGGSIDNAGIANKAGGASYGRGSVSHAAAGRRPGCQSTAASTTASAGITYIASCSPTARAASAGSSDRCARKSLRRPVTSGPHDAPPRYV